MQSVHQQSLPQSPAAEIATYRKTSEQRGRHYWILGEPFGDLLRNTSQINGVLRKRVKTCNRPVIRGDYKRDRYSFFQVLPRLLLQVRIQFFATARKSRPVMFGPERLNDEFGSLTFVGQLQSHLCSVARSSGTSSLVRSRRIEDRTDENFAGLIPDR